MPPFLITHPEPSSEEKTLGDVAGDEAEASKEFKAHSPIRSPVETFLPFYTPLGTSEGDNACVKYLWPSSEIQTASTEDSSGLEASSEAEAPMLRASPSPRLHSPSPKIDNDWPASNQSTIPTAAPSLFIFPSPITASPPQTRSIYSEETALPSLTPDSSMRTSPSPRLPSFLPSLEVGNPEANQTAILSAEPLLTASPTPRLPFASPCGMLGIQIRLLCSPRNHYRKSRSQQFCLHHCLKSILAIQRRVILQVQLQLRHE